MKAFSATGKVSFDLNTHIFIGLSVSSTSLESANSSTSAGMQILLVHGL